MEDEQKWQCPYAVLSLSPLRPHSSTSISGFQIYPYSFISLNLLPAYHTTGLYLFFLSVIDMEGFRTDAYIW